MVQTVINACANGGLFAIISLGLAMVFGIMNLANFAYGNLIMVGGYVILQAASLPWPVVVVASIAVAGIVSWLMERIAFRPVRFADENTNLITSFGVSIFLTNLAALLFGRRAKGVSFGASLQRPLEFWGVSITASSIVALGVVIVVLAGFIVFLQRSPLGLKMRAASEDFEAIRLLGVDANWVMAVAFIVSGILAGIGSVIYVSVTGTVSPTMGLEPVIVAFVAVIVGGLRSLLGAALAGFGLGVLQILLQTYLPNSITGYRDAFLFGSVIFVLIFLPNGLFGRKAMAGTRV